MARPEKNTVDYYPHIVGDGKKMFFIETKYGNDGYSTWHKILEKLCDTDYHYLNLNNEEEVMYLSAKCKVTEERLLSIINDIVKLGKFDKELWTNKIIWCQDFVDSIDDAYKKRNNECITLTELKELLLSLGVLKPSYDTEKVYSNTQRIVEKRIVKKIREEREFSPPVFDDVFIFFKEQKITGWDDLKCEFEAKKFIKHYDQTDWKIKNGQITNWKSTASGWIETDIRFQNNNKKPQPDKNFPDGFNAAFASKLSQDDLKLYHEHIRANGWYLSGYDSKGVSIYQQINAPPG